MLAFDRAELIDGLGRHPTIRKNCITEDGKAEAWLLSKFFEKYQVPVGKVYSSPICRTIETANIVLPNKKIDIRSGLVYPHIGANMKERFKFLNSLLE